MINEEITRPNRRYLQYASKNPTAVPLIFAAYRITVRLRSREEKNTERKRIALPKYSQHFIKASLSLRILSFRLILAHIYVSSLLLYRYIGAIIMSMRGREWERVNSLARQPSGSHVFVFNLCPPFCRRKRVDLFVYAYFVF